MARPITRTVTGNRKTTGLIPLNIYGGGIAVSKGGSGVVSLQATLDNVFNDYNPGETLTINVAIDGEGTPDSFSWGTGASYTNGAEGVDILAGGNDLGNGVILTFAATTGHTDTESWTFPVTPLSAGTIAFTGAGLNDLTATGYTSGEVDWFTIMESGPFEAAGWLASFDGPYSGIRAVSESAAASTITVLQGDVR